MVHSRLSKGKEIAVKMLCPLSGWERREWHRWVAWREGEGGEAVLDGAELWWRCCPGQVRSWHLPASSELHPYGHQVFCGLCSSVHSHEDLQHPGLQEEPCPRSPHAAGAPTGPWVVGFPLSFKGNFPRRIALTHDLCPSQPSPAGNMTLL